VQIRIPQGQRLTERSIPAIAEAVRQWWARVVPTTGWVYPPTPEAAPPPFNVPPDLVTFTGREGLLEELDGLLQPGGQAAVAIVGLKGMAGVGKSALAIHAAHVWRGRFPDGVVWADLRGENAARDALRHVAGLYGYRDQAKRIGDDIEALSALARTVLQGKRALVILDNAEGLKAEEVKCLLPGVAGPVTVVTSRKWFGALRRVSKRLRVDVMEEGEALALLGKLVGAEEVEGKRAEYAELAERLGRLPLALDIAGRRMAERGWGPGEMMRRLEAAADRPAFLALPLAEGPEDSVGLAFALSYEGLEEGDRELFRALGAFAAAGFTARALASVVGREVNGEAALEGLEGEARKRLEEALAAGASVMETDSEAAEEALERLEALSLVRRAERGEERYDLHPLLRDYAQALAGKAGERERWAERHARCFVALADWGGRQLGDPETAVQAVRTTVVERANLMAAQESYLGLGMWDEAVSLAYRLDRLFERSGHWADRRRALERGIRAAREGEKRRDEATLIHNLGIVALDQGNYIEAQRLYEDSLGINRALGNRAGVARSLHELGIVAQAQGDYVEAQRLYEETLEIERAVGDRAGVAQTVHNLGVLAQGQGDYTKARRLHKESLEMNWALGDRAAVARVLHELGTVAQAEGKYAEARRRYGESLEIKLALGNRAGVGHTLHNLGVLAEGQGEYAEVRWVYEESLEIARGLGDRAWMAETLHNLGVLAQDQGKYTEARRRYGESLEIARGLGDRAVVARSLNGLGNLAFAEDDRETARKLLSESLEIAESMGDRLQIAYASTGLAVIEEGEGHLTEALDLIQEAERIFAELGSPLAERAGRDRERMERGQGGKGKG